MLGLFSNDDKHPLADSREAKRIIAAITAGEALGALEDAGAWLESLTAEGGFKLAQRLDLVLRIDEAAMVQARRLGRDYPAQHGATRALEARQWEDAHNYWQHLVAAYLDCLARHDAAEKKDADTIRSQMPLLWGRLVNALAAQLKWKQFRYGPVDPVFWQTLGRIYLAAVDAKAAQKPIALYAGTPETTIESEYLKVLIFHATSMDKLQPLGIEIAERFIGYFMPYFSLIREVRPENVYWVDAAKPLPPTRLAQLPEVTPTLRFFNGTRAVDAVNATIEQIRREERVPPGINLGGTYDLETVIPVLQHLAVCWAPKPPMRSTARHRMSSPLKVVNGLDAIYRALESGVAEGAESWAIDDVSLGGLGAQVSSRVDWIRIGAMVGMQPHGGDNWLVGIVRRFVRTGQTQGAVGIETVSKTPRAVVADAGGLETAAILLDVPVAGEYVRAALAANQLEAGVVLVVPYDGMTARLYPRDVVASGAGYVIANFFVQSLG